MEHLPRQRVKRSTSTLKGEAERGQVDESDTTERASAALATLQPDQVERPPTPVTTSTGRSRSRHPLPIPPNHRLSEKIETVPEGPSHDATVAEAAPQVVAGGDVVGGAEDEVAVSAVGLAPQRISDGLGANPQGSGSVWDAVVATYRDRPVAFVQDLLVKGTPGFVIEDWQKRFLEGRRSRRAPDQVRAGHGVGKSAACAWAMIWFMFSRYPVKADLHGTNSVAAIRCSFQRSEEVGWRAAAVHAGSG